MKDAKKLKDLLPDKFSSQPLAEVSRIQEDKKLREQSSVKFLVLFEKEDEAGKFSMITQQTRGLLKTSETVMLPGRVKAEDEPEVLYLMVLELFAFAGMNDKMLIRSVVDIMLDLYGWMALQDFALFFKKIKAGSYGEVYGKLSGMWITGKIQNFQQSVIYHKTMDDEAEHYMMKQLDGCRGLDTYYDDVKPKVIE